MEFARKGVKVELVDIGEGLNGEYNENDPSDIPLLRFYISIRKGQEWIYVEDASYCTQIHVNTDSETQLKVCMFIWDEFTVFKAVNPSGSIKKLCANLSWIGVDSYGNIVLD